MWTKLLLNKLAIIPPYPVLSIDYPSSVAAIGFADFGAIGVVLAALLVGSLFRLYWAALNHLARWPLAYIALISALLQLAISQEAGLTAILATGRDVLLFSALYVPLSFFFRAGRRLIIRAVRKLPDGVATGS